MATRTFRGTVNADWNTAGNWLELAVPTTADDVVFDAASPACTMSAAANCLTLDCTGFLATITPGANLLTVAGTLFRLVAGCWVTGSASPSTDFTAAAGTVLITTTGNTLNSLRFGNVAAGAVYQLQDALVVTLDLNCVRGTFDGNGQTITVGRDVITAATMAADGFRLGAGTLNIGRDWNNAKALVMSTATGYGTSQVNFTGTGKIGGAGFQFLTFWNLFVAAAGQITTFNHSGSGKVGVANLLTTGTGSAVILTSGSVSLTGALNQPFVPNPAVTWNVPITFSPPTGQALCQIPGINYGAIGVITLTHTATTICTYQLIGNVICGGVSLFQTGTANAQLIDLNGFNWAVNGNWAAGSGAVQTLIIGAATLTVTGNFAYAAPANQPTTNETRLVSLTTGKLLVGGNVVLTNGTATKSRIQMGVGAELRVGGNWDSTGTGPVFTAADERGIINFNAAGAFTIAAIFTERWPNIQVTGGGTCTLPAGFNCNNLQVFNGTLTTAGDLYIRNAYNGAATSSLTVTGSLFIGSGFVSAGVVVTAGSNIQPTGAVCSISGVNPATLTLTKECIRLQLLTSMNITTLVLADRDTPAVVQFLAGGTYNVGTLNSQVVPYDAPVQFISSVAGTYFNFNVTVLTSARSIWPRDVNSSASPVAIACDASNKDLRHNLGWTGMPNGGQVRVITDDPGQDQLADGGYGLYQYCWLVANSLANLLVLRTNFLAGDRNWFRRTNIPFAVLDNLTIFGTYYVALGLRDERDRRFAPDVAGGDYATITADTGGGGGSHHIYADFGVPHVG
jgi:hypothetical protein